MPRQRMVKPEFFESDSLAECTYAARLAFIGLWCQADDKGHAKASVRKLRKLIFPLEDMTDAEFEGYLAELEAVGCIKHYEVDGKGYIEVVNFTVYQNVNRPSKTTVPDPPEELAKTKLTHRFIPYDGMVTDSSLNAHGTLPDDSQSVSGHGALTFLKERSKEESILTTSKILSSPNFSDDAETPVENFDPAIEEELDRILADSKEQKFPHCSLCESPMDFETFVDPNGVRCHTCPNCGPIPYTKAVWR